MSESNFGESQAHFKAKDAKPTLNPLVHWLGAAVSVSVLGVMVYWGLQLVQRDPSEVPVIKAMAGPARVLPEDPGGSQSAYTGLAVNTVQSDGEAEKPSDRVVLAPPPPHLKPEDVAIPETMVAAKSEEKPVAELILNSVQDAMGDGTAPDATTQGTGDDSVTLTVTEVPDGMRLDTSGGQAKLVADDGAMVVAAAEPVVPQVPPTRIEGSKYAPETSLIPRIRANDLKLTMIGEAKKPKVSPLAREVPDVPLGTRLIQLGAYDSRDTALREWVRISGRYHDLLDNKNFLVQLAESGGHQFYRLRAVGFADSNESKAMCSALIQRGAQCIPVVAR